MKLGLVQQANSSDRAANIEKLKQNIRACALQGAELVVLQELHNGLYFCQTENTEVFDQAEPIPGPSTEGFGALAKELGIGKLVAIGEKARAIALGAEGMEVDWFPTVAEALPVIEGVFVPGTVLLVKASHAMHFPAIVDRLRGCDTVPRRE